VLLYNTLTDSWKTIGNIPFDTPVTTTAVKWGNDVIIPSGEIKAGVRSPNILSVKILQKEK
jgi:N-acetylneuraminic acid mutarotase